MILINVLITIKILSYKKIFVINQILLTHNFLNKSNKQNIYLI